MTRSAVHSRGCRHRPGRATSSTGRMLSPQLHRRCPAAHFGNTPTSTLSMSIDTRPTSGTAAASATHHRRTARRMPRITVGITATDRGNPRVSAHRLPAAAIAHRLLAGLQPRAPQSPRRVRLIAGRRPSSPAAQIGKRRGPVKHDARPQPVHVRGRNHQHRGRVGQRALVEMARSSRSEEARSSCSSVSCCRARRRRPSG